MGVETIIAVVALVVSVGSAIYSASLTPDSPDDVGANITKQGTTATKNIVYGRCKVSCVSIWNNVWDDSSKYLINVFQLGGFGKYEAIHNVYIEDKQLLATDLNIVTDPNIPWDGLFSAAPVDYKGVRYFPIADLDSEFRGQVIMQVRSGNGGRRNLMIDPTGPSQEKHLELAEYFGDGEWTEDHRGDGVPQIAIRAKRITDKDGVVILSDTYTIYADVSGLHLFDVRDNVWRYSANPSLALYDYLTSTDYGMGIPREYLNTDSFINVANICDFYGYEIHAEVNTQQQHSETLTKLLSTFQGCLVQENGQLLVKFEQISPVVADFDDTNILSQIEVTDQQTNGYFNAIEIKYKNYTANEKEESYVLPVDLYNDERIIKDGFIQTTTFDMLYTIDGRTSDDDGSIVDGAVHDFAAREYNRTRFQKAVKFDIDLNEYDVRIWDIITLTNDILGWDKRKFRISSMSKSVMDENLNVATISASWYDPSIYRTEISNSGGLPRPKAIPISQPAGLTFNLTTFITSGYGTLSWQSTYNSPNRSFDVEYKLSSQSNWVAVARTPELVWKFSTLKPDSYDFRVRVFDSTRGTSDWTVLTGSTISPNATFPSVTGVAVVSFTDDMVVSWDDMTDDAVYVPDSEDPTAELDGKVKDYWKNYEISVYHGNGSGGWNFVKVYNTTSNIFTYSFENNLENGLNRTIKVEVVIRGKDGTTSTLISGSSTTATNPQVSSPTNVNIYGKIGMAWFNFDLPSDYDFSGTEIHVSNDPGFYPSISTLVSELGRESMYVWYFPEDSSESDYRYVRIGHFDKFGKTGINYSPEVLVEYNSIQNELNPYDDSELVAMLEDNALAIEKNTQDIEDNVTSLSENLLIVNKNKEDIEANNLIISELNISLEQNSLLLDAHNQLLESHSSSIIENSDNLITVQYNVDQAVLQVNDTLELVNSNQLIVEQAVADVAVAQQTVDDAIVLINSNQEIVEQAVADVAENKILVEQAVADVEENTILVNQVKSDVEDNQLVIDQAVSDIAANKIVVDKTVSDIAANKIVVDKTVSDIAANKIVVDKTVSDIAANKIVVDKTVSDIAANKIVVDKTVSDIAANKIVVDKTVSDIAANKIVVDKTVSDIAANKIVVDKTVSDIAANKIVVDKTVSDIAANKIVVDKNTSDIAAIGNTANYIPAISASLASLRDASNAPVNASGEPIGQRINLVASLDKTETAGFGLYATNAGVSQFIIAADELIIAGGKSGGNVANDSRAFYYNSVTSSLVLNNATIVDLTAANIKAGTITATQIATGTITATQIAASTITAAKIASNTITATQIAASTITAAKIATGTITATQIAASTITAANIAANTITATQIAAGTITAAEIYTRTITTDLIAVGTIVGANIKAGTITASLITSNTITATQIAAGTITTTEIKAGTITAANIAANTITATQIAAGTITAAEIYTRTITTDLIAVGTIVGANIKAGTITASLITSNTITATQIAAGTITTTEIKAGTITAANIAANTITAANIGVGVITAAEIKALTITGSLIAANTITATQIAASTITAAKIAANTITATQIAAGTITTTEIKAGTITAANIAANTITAANIGVGVITAAEIKALTITGALIAANTITAANIGVGVITAAEIKAGTITASEIATGTITATQIAASTITAAKIATGTITAANIAANTITAANIGVGVITAAEIKALTITGALIAANTITATQIAASTITATQIAASTITAAKIATGTITATQIASNTITTNEIKAGTIKAANIESNTITANQIAASTITATQIAANTITAAKIAANTITGDQISSTTTITAGSGTTQAGMNGNDATASIYKGYRFWAGGADPATAPYRVTSAGEVFAENLNTQLSSLSFVQSIDCGDYVRVDGTGEPTHPDCMVIRTLKGYKKQKVLLDRFGGYVTVTSTGNTTWKTLAGGYLKLHVGSNTYKVLLAWSFSKYNSNSNTTEHWFTTADEFPIIYWDVSASTETNSVHGKPFAISIESSTEGLMPVPTNVQVIAAVLTNLKAWSWIDDDALTIGYPD